MGLGIRASCIGNGMGAGSKAVFKEAAQKSVSVFVFFSSRRRHTRFDCDWSSDVCSSDLIGQSRRLFNAVGYEQSTALADVREMEARHSLATYGINDAWFLHGSDTPGADEIGRASCRERV